MNCWLGGGFGIGAMQALERATPKETTPLSLHNAYQEISRISSGYEDIFWEYLNMFPADFFEQPCTLSQVTDAVLNMYRSTRGEGVFKAHISLPNGESRSSSWEVNKLLEDIDLLLKEYLDLLKMYETRFRSDITTLNFRHSENNWEKILEERIAEFCMWIAFFMKKTTTLHLTLDSLRKSSSSPEAI